ncbi:MAG: cysteine desulfurase NifS [Verrucomicrobiota bacterium]|nr:cysteine desulfurase NifS [Verrucomicrobiota bacterium]
MTVRKADIIYVDNNATTQVDPLVVETMVPFLSEFYGNPSSAYNFGRQVAEAIDKAREQVAALLKADPREIIFTSCGTESDNAAINSALLLNPSKKHIVTTKVEHSAIKNQCEFLKSQGYEITILPVDAQGRITPEQVEAAIRPDTAIVSIMWANNETGVILPVEHFAEIAKKKGTLFHTDAVQAVGKIPIDMSSNKIDMLSISGHKLHCPKGIGVLYIRRRVSFKPMVIGGSQERGKRGGTENVASIVALGKACELAGERLAEENTRVKALRDRFESEMKSRVPDIYVSGDETLRLPNTCNIAFDFVEAEAVLMLLDQEGICCSSGSACTTGSLDPSHVLSAMGLTPARARGAVRFSFCTYNTDEHIDKLITVVPPVISKLRAISPLNKNHPDNENYDIAKKREEEEKLMNQIQD